MNFCKGWAIENGFEQSVLNELSQPVQFFNILGFQYFLTSKLMTKNLIIECCKLLWEKKAEN